MTEEDEEVGMMDLQFKSFLRGMVADLQRIKAAGVSEDAAKSVDDLIERYKTGLEE